MKSKTMTKPETHYDIEFEYVVEKLTNEWQTTANIADQLFPGLKGSERQLALSKIRNQLNSAAKYKFAEKKSFPSINRPNLPHYRGIRE